MVSLPIVKVTPEAPTAPGPQVPSSISTAVSAANRRRSSAASASGCGGTAHRRTVPSADAVTTSSSPIHATAHTGPT